MTKKDLLDRIEIRADVMLGKPVIRGTRITVEILLEKLAADCSIEDVLQDYPALKRDDVLAALSYARQALGTDEIFPPNPHGVKAWKLLADENLEAGIIRALREAGHDVLAVAETKPRSSDEDILDAARRQKRVLVTNDKDFAELVFLQGRASEGIILLRMSRLRTQTKATRLTSELAGRSASLGRAMLVIDEAAARVRPVHGSSRIRRKRS